jgi:hypothetical protein
MRSQDVVLKIVREVSQKHPASIEDAAKEAFDKVVSLKQSMLAAEYAGIVDSLMLLALRRMIEEHRHSCNSAQKESARKCSPLYVPSHTKVRLGTSKIVLEGANNIYNYYINGITLGRQLGKELVPNANKWFAQGKGTIGAAKLNLRLSTIVPDEKTVQQVVPKKKLWKMFCEEQERASSLVI